MTKMTLAAIGLIGMLAAGPSPLLAAEISDPLTEAELTLYPGDTIIWSPASVHRLRFGGKVRGNSLTLTTFADIQKVLDITANPPLSVGPGDMVRGASAQQITATVKKDAHTSGVSEFFFTCGFNNDHADDMVTVSFKIAAPGAGPSRTVEIPTSSKWLLKTPVGEKSLTRP